MGWGPDRGPPWGRGVGKQLDGAQSGEQDWLMVSGGQRGSRRDNGSFVRPAKDDTQSAPPPVMNAARQGGGRRQRNPFWADMG